MKHPRLRDSKRLLTYEPYPLNEIPETVIKEIGKKFVYMRKNHYFCSEIGKFWQKRTFMYYTYSVP